MTSVFRRPDPFAARVLRPGIHGHADFHAKLDDRFARRRSDFNVNANMTNFIRPGGGNYQVFSTTRGPRTLLRRHRSVRVRWTVRARARFIRPALGFRYTQPLFRNFSIDNTRRNLRIARRRLRANRCRFSPDHDRHNRSGPADLLGPRLRSAGSAEPRRKRKSCTGESSAGRSTYSRRSRRPARTGRSRDRACQSRKRSAARDATGFDHGKQSETALLRDARRPNGRRAMFRRTSQRSVSIRSIWMTRSRMRWTTDMNSDV